MIPTIISVRGILISSIFAGGLAAFLIANSSKEKSDYLLTSGTIEHFGQTYGSLPLRNKGDYRYLKLSSYPYVFEIYKPNSETNQFTLDDLVVGDTVDVFYYEIENTHTEAVNRFAQFVDKESRPYFIRSGFRVQLGLMLIAMILIINIVGYIFWKKGKLEW